MKFNRLITFFKHDLWQIEREDTTYVRFVLIGVLKKLLLSVEFFTAKRVMDMAAALTYSTMLAIVPIFAVVFAIARGFGYSKYIEVWFRESLSSQPQVAETIIDFVNSYLVHTKSGIFLGVGLLMMLFTVLMLTANVEKTFNSIWQVKHPRSIYRAITDYITMMFLVPVVIVLTSGVSIVVATLAGQAGDYYVVGPVMKAAVDILPYVLMSVVFMGLYLFMPNTKVRFSVVIVPGILAGVGMQMLQLFYIHAQMFLSSYNAIYGSFAALPLFMLWVQISWTICLFGVELCYTNQNMDELSFNSHSSQLSNRYRLLLSSVLLAHICRRFERGSKPYTALDLKIATNIPTRVTQDLLFCLVRAGLLSESSAEGKDAEPTYQPALPLSKMTIGTLVERLDSLGEWTLDIDLHEQLDSLAWKEYLESRKQFLEKLREINILSEEVGEQCKS